MMITQSPLLIGGFHRSGTSLCAQVLGAGGLFLGERLLGAQPSNPYGHFEDEEIVRFHDRLLGTQGHGWFLPGGATALNVPSEIAWANRFVLRRCARGGLWGFKDPRLCLTIRFWSAVLPRINILYIHRDPTHSITSMWQRAWGETKAGRALDVNEPLARDKGLVAAIYAHNVRSFLSARTARRSQDRFEVVAYDDVVAGRVDLIDLVRQRFGLVLEPVDFAAFYDVSAVTADSTPLCFGEGMDRELKDLDDTMRALARTDGNADGSTDGNEAATGGTSRGAGTGREVRIREDALTYAYAAADVREAVAQRRLQALKEEETAMRAELDAMQVRLDGSSAAHPRPADMPSDTAVPA